MLPAMQIEAFFSEARRNLDEAQRGRRRNVASLFSEIAPRLASAKRLDRALDQHLARRFNVLDYLRTDELGLSRIIADLLNPVAGHGQRALFLGEFLNLLREHLPLHPPALGNDDRVRVTLEYEIENQRRIDILVEIPSEPSPWALAIENKPYAGDQKHQVQAYLRHLEGKYAPNFLLIYLSPTGEGPSEYSVKRRELQKHWQDNFAVLPYHQHSDSAESDHPGAEPEGTGGESNDNTQPEGTGSESGGTGMRRLPFSLADWLQTCRRECEVDRLRWFLGDAIQFCQITFGGQTMTSKHESKTIRDFLFDHPEHLETALAVHDSWPSIRDQICKTFLERLKKSLKKKIKEDPQLVDFKDDLEVDCKYGGRPRYSNQLWLYRKQWREYENGEKNTSQRTAIMLQSDGYGPNSWCVGVRSSLRKENMVDADKERREKTEKELEKKLGPSQATSGSWPHWKHLDTPARNWESIVPDLHSENEADQPGKITSCIVDKIVDIAAAAIPIINECDQ